MSSHPRDKRQRIRPLPQGIESTAYDIAIVGAGINGSGIARDAAMRGLSVLLVDMGDIGGQTTAWSTRLIHGGLRYLEHAEIGLVRESLRERQTLLAIAPHLVEPLRFLVPIYRSHRRGPLTIRMGMLAYDALSIGKQLPRHRMLSRNEALRQEPGLERRGLKGSAQYYDAQVTFPERLALENALSAHEHDCDVGTYLRATRVERGTDGLMRITLQDEIEGVELGALARVVVNATGPWVDDLGAASGTARLIGGTKGSHVVVEGFPGAPTCAVYAEASSDRRPFFVIPWNGRYLIGTTDSRFSGEPSEVAATEDDVDYLLEQTNAIFPRAGLTRLAIRFTYAGIRPLPFSDQDAESAITRRHGIVRHDAPYEMMLSVVGGKLTTYRELAEQVTDRVFEMLELPDPGSKTATTPLPGAKLPSVHQSSRSGMAEQLIASGDRLERVYGSRANDVVAFAEACGDTGTIGSSEVLRGEVAFAVEHELAQTLEDTLMRRTMAGLTSMDATDFTEEALGLLAECADWDAEQVQEERERYATYLARFRVPGDTVEAGER